MRKASQASINFSEHINNGSVECEIKCVHGTLRHSAKAREHSMVPAYIHAFM